LVTSELEGCESCFELCVECSAFLESDKC